MTSAEQPRTTELEDPPSARVVEDLLYPHRKALAELMRSEALSRGDVAGALQLVTEVAAQLLRVERASVWRFREDRSALECANLFQRTPRKHSEGESLLAASFPSYFRALAEERSIAIRNAYSDPRTREFRDTYLTARGISAMLDAPIFVRGTMVGVVCHEHVGGERNWQIWEELVAGSIADFVALAIEAAEQNRADQKLHAQQQHLEALVAARTAELTRANTHLQLEVEGRKKVEDRLRHSEENLKKLFEVSPVSLVLIGAVTQKVVLANRRTTELFEIAADQLVGQPVAQYYAYADAADRAQLLALIEKGGHGDSYEARLKTSTGREFFALISVQRLVFEGEPAFLVSALDISAQKAVETRLRELATRDPLTECVNRRYFLERVSNEFERATRYGNAVSLAMVDADHFKEINDRYGHGTGDVALRAIADRCRGSLRKTDVLGRFGGEEFVILFVETGLAEAQRVAERLLTKVAEPVNAGDGPSIAVTISAGVVERRPGESVDSVLKRADEALYRAKAAGRNRVVAQ